MKTPILQKILLCSFALLVGTNSFAVVTRDSLIQSLKNKQLTIIYGKDNLFVIKNYTDVLTGWKALLTGVETFAREKAPDNPKFYQALVDLNKTYKELTAAVTYARHAIKLGKLDPAVDTDARLFRQLRTEFEANGRNMIQLQYTLNQMKKLKPNEQDAKDVLWQAAVYVQEIAKRIGRDFGQRPWRK